MAEQQTQYAPGGHYSAKNPVPTVKKFIENLDKDKAERDRNIDLQSAAKQKQAAANGDAVPHKPQRMGVEGTQKTVTDPTTGKQVVIEDVSKKVLHQVEDPTLSVPNANLGRDTVRVCSLGTNILYMLTRHSTLRPMPHNQGKNIAKTKTSQHHRTR